MKTARSCLHSARLIALLALAAAPASAALITWSGAGADDNLATPGNWFGDVAPVATDDVVFTGATRVTPISTSQTFLSITFDSSASAFTLSGAALVTGTTTPSGGSVTNASSFPQTFNCGFQPRVGTLLASGGDIILNGSFNVGNGGNGTGRNITVDGAQNVIVNTALTGTGTDSSAGGQLLKNGAGTLYLNGSSPAWTGKITINVGGLVITNANALGSSAGTTVINSSGGAGILDGRLVLSNNLTLTERFTLGARLQGTLNSAHIINAADINTLTGTNTLTTGGSRYNLQADAGKLIVAGVTTAGTLTGTREFRVAGAAEGELRGPILGGGASILFYLIKDGSGLWTLTGTNSVNGITLISAGPLALGPNGSLVGSTNITVAAGATFDVSAVTGGYKLNANQTLAGAGTVNGNVTTLAGSQLRPGGAGAAGTLSFANHLTLNTGTTNYFELGNSTTPGVSSDLVNVTGNLEPNGAPIVISSLNTLVVPGTYRLFNYSGAKTTSFGSVVVADARYTATLDESVSGQVNVTLSGTSSGLTWSGGGANNWDVNASTNWNNNTEKFFNSDAASFNNSSASNTVNLVGLLYPSTVSVNSDSNYIFGGAGKLSGATGLSKSGNGSLTISNANDFTGVVNVTGGTLVAANAALLGATNGGTFISGGGTLDVFNKNLGLEPITIAGAGVGGAGAIVNTAAEQQNAIRFLTLNGDASIGGVNRWDVRGAGGSGSFSGALDLGGFTLSKTGTNKISIVDTLVLSNGNFVISNGTLAFTRSQVSGPGFIDLGTNVLQLENFTAGFLDKPVRSSGGRLLVTGNAFTLGSAVTNLAGLTIDNAVGLTLTNEFTGAGSLTKLGVGTLTFERPVGHAGATDIQAGGIALGVGSSLAASTPITVGASATLDVTALPAGLVLNSGQTLGGSGTVFGNVTAGPGTGIIPGTSPGTLAISGNLSLDSITSTFELGADPFTAGANDLITVSGDLTLAGVSSIKIVPLAALNTASPYTLFQYGSFSVGSIPNLTVSSDSRYSFTVLDPTTTPGAIQVQVSGTGAAATLAWRGNAPVNPTYWDTKTTANWFNGATADLFFLGDTAEFDDSAVGTSVSLVGTLQPAVVRLNNNAKTFAIAGAGSLLAGSLEVNGAGATTIANTSNNSLINGLSVNNGSLTIRNTGANTLGAVTLNGGALALTNTAGNTFASLTLNSGALSAANAAANAFGTVNLTGGSLLLANSVANTFASLTLDGGTLTLNHPFNLTFGTAITGGGGTLAKDGTNQVTLSANNSGFSGAIAVNAGILRAGVANSLGNESGGTTVAAGATLDVNAINLGNEPVTVSGAGVNGLGAIVNNSATAQQNALHNVTLAGHTVFGGVNRWDIRTNATGLAEFSTGGNSYNLTKVGVNYFPLVSANVDAALGDVDVQAGGFGYEFWTSGLGDPTKTLNVASNAYFLMYGALNPLDKHVRLQGGAQLRSQNASNTILGPVLLPGGLASILTDVHLTLANEVSGAGSLEKSGTNTLYLNAANTFTGTLLVTNGALTATHPDALGANRLVTVRYGTVTGGSGTRLGLAGNIVTPASVAAHFITTTNGGDFRTSLITESGSNVWTGPVWLTGDALVNFNAGLTATLGVTGPLLASNSFTATAFFRGGTTNSYIDSQLNLPLAAFNITDNSAWRLNSTGNIWARSIIAYGRVILGADNALCPAAPLTLGQSGTSTGTLDLNGHSQEVPSLATLNGLNHFIGSSSTTADSIFVYKGGTNLSVYGAAIVDSVAGGTMKVAVTTKSGTLQLNGTNLYTGPTLVEGGVLGGTGSLLSAVTVQPAGTLAPGASIGTLTVSNEVTLGGTNLMEVSKTGTTITNDLLRGVSTLHYGGTLQLALSGDALAAGDTITLYDATAYQGGFNVIIPATPGANLAWDTSALSTTGTLQVVPKAAPTISAFGLLGDGNFSLTLDATLGQPYSIRTSTNAGAPILEWSLLTNGTIPSVPFLFNDLTATNHPQRYYIISTP